jgi:hypothetical protein
MVRPRPPRVDPAADAAALLRRLGFATLLLAIPVSALVARRALVVLAPLGVALLVIASVLDGEHRGVREALRRVAGTYGGLAAALVLFWCGLSLLWTPFVPQATERLGNILATLGIGVAGYLALPDRMRSANLYLVAIGAGLAALTATLLLLFSGDGVAAEADAQTLERGLVVLVLVAWPAIAWLRSRGRDIEALALGLGVGLAAGLASYSLPLIAFGAGAVAFALTSVRPTLGVKVTAFVTAGLLAAAPLLPFVLSPLFESLSPDTLQARGAAIWRTLVLEEPLRLITGHGFETALRGRLVGLLPSAAPRTVLFEIWYELGVVGAFAGAYALWASVTATGRLHAALLPGAMAAFATAYTSACLGIGTAQMWWFTALVLVVLIFTAAERGQFRTTRPKAVVSGAVAKD